MAGLWLWNAVTTRSRSGSDVFFDNGLAILKTYVEGKGHSVHVEDWATLRFFHSLSPALLTRPLRWLYRRAANARSPRTGKLWAAAALPLQALLNLVQRRRMERRLDDLAERFLASGCRVFGIKTWYGEAFTWSKRLVAKILARDPSILTLAGGYHATMYEEDILRHSNFDLAVISEGEYALTTIMDLVQRRLPGWDKSAVIAELVEMAERGDLDNLAYRTGGKVHMSPRAPHCLDKVAPDYGSFEDKVPVHVLTESVGCAWGKCSFCVHTHFNGKYRQRSIADIVAEMKAMARQGVSMFRFAESDTPAPRGARLGRAMMDAGLEVEYVIGNRAVRGALDEGRYRKLVEQYGVMMKSGLRAIFMGGETGNDWANEHVMNKGVRRENLIRTCRAIKEAREATGIVCDLVLALIYPLPTLQGVTLEQVFEDNMSLIREVAPDVVHPNPPAPLKSSQWYRERDKFGFDLAPSFISTMMEYEFCLYKPTAMWPPLDISLEGRDFRGIVSETDRFRRAVNAAGFNTNLSDEHCAMMRIAGYRGHEGAARFRTESFLDIVSCDYRMIEEVCRKVSEHSRAMAARSVARFTAREEIEDLQPATEPGETSSEEVLGNVGTGGAR